MKVNRLTKDISPEVEMYSIKSYEDRKAYEGHYLHYDVEVETRSQNWTYRAGDYVVFTDQPAVRYIIETLEPQAPDSYFAWNFFDGILMQKEGFSDYVFEDIAAEFLEENPDVRRELEELKSNDPDFAKSKWAQLGFVYKKTPHFEKTYQLYPVARMMNATTLPIE